MPVGADFLNPPKIKPLNKNGIISSFQSFRKGSNFLETCTISEIGQNWSTKMVKKGKNSSIKRNHFRKGSKIVKKIVPFKKRVKNCQQKWYHFGKGSKFLNKKWYHFRKGSKFLNKNSTISVRKGSKILNKMIPYLERVKNPQQK